MLLSIAVAALTLAPDLPGRGVRPEGRERPARDTPRQRFGDTARGRAVTQFSFEQFGMTKPRVASVLSVEDTIILEYDFTLRRE